VIVLIVLGGLYFYNSVDKVESEDEGSLGTLASRDGEDNFLANDVICDTISSPGGLVYADSNCTRVMKRGSSELCNTWKLEYGCEDVGERYMIIDGKCVVAACSNLGGECKKMGRYNCGCCKKLSDE